MAKRAMLIRVALLLHTHIFRTSGVASQCCQLHSINSSSVAGGVGMRTRLPSVFVQRSMISQARTELFVKAQGLPNEDAANTARMALEAEIEEAMADGVIVDAEQMKINDKKGMFSKAIEDSAYKGTLHLHVEGVGDGVAPIRQSLTQVSAGDSMKDDFVPIFWFEDESPTPPQIVSSTEGKESSIAISASMNDIFKILGDGQWYISGNSPGNVTRIEEF